MRTQISTEKGKLTNVKLKRIVNIKTLDTPSHIDDRETWNAYEPYGESDVDESMYKAPVKMRISKANRERMRQIISRKVDWSAVSGAV